MVKRNAEYGIGERSHASDGTKRRELDVEKLALVKDAHVRMARRLAGGGATIPPDRNYAEQTRAAGLDHVHGLRPAYALDRYEDLTGWKASAARGPARRRPDGGERGIECAA